LAVEKLKNIKIETDLKIPVRSFAMEDQGKIAVLSSRDLRM